MDKNAFEVFLRFLERQRLVVDYVHIAGFSLLVWDFCLTITLEVETVWKSKWNYTKVLFLLTRYIPIINIFFILHNQLLPDVTEDSCGWTFSAASWLIVAGVCCAEAILCIRTWAVWHQKRSVLIGLALLQIGVLIVNCYSTDKYLHSMQLRPPLYPGFRGCLVVGASGILWLNFFALTLSQTVILSLMIVKAASVYRASHMNELSNVVHRDGIFFYIVLLVIAITNLVVILVLPPDFENLFTPLQSIFHSVFTTRIIMNIRTVGNRDMMHPTSMELHSSFYNTRPVSLSLTFRQSMHHDALTKKVEETHLGIDIPKLPYQSADVDNATSTPSTPWPAETV